MFFSADNRSFGAMNCIQSYFEEQSEATLKSKTNQ